MAKTFRLALTYTLHLKVFSGKQRNLFHEIEKKFYNVVNRFGILILPCLFVALAARVFEEKTLDKKIDGEY